MSKAFKKKRWNEEILASPSQSIEKPYLSVGTMYFNKDKQWYSPSYMHVCGCKYSLSNSIIERSIRIIIKSFSLSSINAPVTPRYPKNDSRSQKSENLNLQALDSRCLSSCCLASWQQMLLPGLETFRHPIDTSSLAHTVSYGILQDTTVCRNLLGCTELLKMQASIHGHYLYLLHFCLFLAHLLFCLFLPGNVL